MIQENTQRILKPAEHLIIIFVSFLKGQKWWEEEAKNGSN